MNTNLQYWWRKSVPAGILQMMVFAFFIAIFMAFISGCGQGANDNSVAQNDSGELIIGLTDAEGDFISYTVDVKSITLTKANGTIVHVLPLTTRVDFAQYTELTEFLTASMVPLGAYKHATMVLDYTNADIRIENATGDTVQATDIQNSEGNPVTELEMVVHLEGRNKLVISRGLPAHLTLDFDLNATNKAVFDDAGVPTVVVEPYLIADVHLQRPKAHRVRGPLNDVDVENNQFEIIINPFHQSQSTDGKFGTLTVMTDDETVYDIDNQSYLGKPGLQAMDVLPQYTATIVTGKF
ncbi:hypothetical protein [Kaarinaea lacus]